MDAFDTLVANVTASRLARVHAENARRLGVVASILLAHVALLSEYGYNAAELAAYITGDYLNANYGVETMTRWNDKLTRRAERMAGISGDPRRGGLTVVVDGTKANTDGGNLFAIGVSIGLVLGGSEPIPVTY
jgi:hypothetical protein